LMARQSTNAFIATDPQLAKAIAFVDRQLSRPFGVEAMVSAAGVSRRHLEMAFRKSLRCSPMIFLSRIRTERAKVLLRREGLSLTRIAQQCGFADLRQFRRTFRKMTQMTPRQFRDSIKSIHSKQRLERA